MAQQRPTISLPLSCSARFVLPRRSDPPPHPTVAPLSTAALPTPSPAAMASFGVALRSTKPIVAAPVAPPPPPRAETPPPPPPPEPLRLWVAPRSLRSAALQMRMEHVAQNGQAQGTQRQIEIRERNPMVGAAVGVSPVGAAASASAASAAANVGPAFSSLPCLDDDGTIVSGWISCLKYLAWKSSMAAPHAPAAASASGSAAVPSVSAVDDAAGFYPLPAGLHTASEVSAAIAAAMPVPPPQAPSAVAAARASFGAVGAGLTAGSSAGAGSTASASPAATASASPPPAPAVVTVSSFVIDSYLESLAPVDCALSELVHCFLTSASRAPSSAAGHVGFLSYKFDREGERIVPRWAQQQHAPASSNKMRAAMASHPHPAGASSDGGETQHALERSLRTVHAFIADIQSRLAMHNPAFNAEKALALMRDTPETSTLPTTRTAAAAALPAVPETKEETTVPASASAATPAGVDAVASAVTPPSSSDPSFRFLLGTTMHTLADFVVLMLLQHCSLLHSYLPLLSPHSHPALFGFVSTMERIYAAEIYTHLGPLTGLDGTNGRHSLLCRHPMLQIVHTPPTPPPAVVQASTQQPAHSPSNHNRRDTTVMSDPAAAAASAGAASTLSVTVTPASHHAPSPTASPGPATSSNPSTPGSHSNGGGSNGGNGGSKPFVPRLTSATDVASTATRGPASSLAVEEVADLMDYVDQVAVRARAATPAAERSKKPPPPSPSPAPSPSPSPAAAAVAPAAPMSSLAWSRLLSQRLLTAVDHASLGWKVVAERGQVRLLTPIEPNPLGDTSSYRSMATRSVRRRRR